MSVKIEKYDGKTVITKESGKPFRILQLTDVHLGGGLFTKGRDANAIDAVTKVIKNANADFVVVTGDIVYPFWCYGGSHNNLKTCKTFARLMEDLGVQWTMVFGNHDSEFFAKATKEDLAEFYSALPNCHFSFGDDELFGVGNYCIPLMNEDGTLNTALMFLDSNDYLGWSFFSGFDTIHSNQIEWYKKTINDLSTQDKQANSLAFFHIPPKEFKDAWDKFYMGGCTDVTYHHGFVGEKDNYFGYPKTVEGRFFKEMVDFGSCKGMFMGHDHLNTLSLTYQGIRLTYGMSIDYLAYIGIGKKHTQRGGTLIDIYDDGSFDVKMLPLDTLECNKRKK